MNTTNKYHTTGVIETPTGYHYDTLQELRGAVRAGCEDQTALDEAERTVH